MTMWATHKLITKANVGEGYPHCDQATKSRRNQSQHVVSRLENFSAIDRGTKSGS